MGAPELFSNVAPPVADVAAFAEGGGVLIADFEEGDFFFGCKSFKSSFFRSVVGFGEGAFLAPGL